MCAVLEFLDCIGLLSKDSLVSGLPICYVMESCCLGCCGTLSFSAVDCFAVICFFRGCGAMWLCGVTFVVCCLLVLVMLCFVEMVSSEFSEFSGSVLLLFSFLLSLLLLLLGYCCRCIHSKPANGPRNDALAVRVEAGECTWCVREGQEQTTCHLGMPSTVYFQGLVF